MDKNRRKAVMQGEAILQCRPHTPIFPIRLRASIRGHADEYENGHFIPPHQHDTVQLIYAYQGVMTVEASHGFWVVPPERAVWVPAFVTHSIRVTGVVRIRTLYIAPSVAPIESEDCCVVQVSRLLSACIERFFSFSTSWPDDGPNARVVSVLLDELRAAPAMPLHLPLPDDPRALKFAEAFRAQPSDRRSVAEWGRFAGASERTLERLFRSEFGMTLSTWQRQARLLRALEVLASGHSVTEAALEAGFETTSAFIAMFRQAMGATPARYFRKEQEDR